MKQFIAFFVLVATILALPSWGATFRKQTISDQEFCDLCETGSVQEVVYAIKNGANVNAKTHYYAHSALMCAIGYGRNEIVNVLLRAGADVNAKADNDQTVLMYAVERGYVDINALLKAGAKVNAKDWLGQTALFYAVDYDNVKAINILLKAGANVNAKTIHGTTALMFAASYANVKAVNVLLKARADVNAKNKEGETALMWAFMRDYLYGDIQTVNALLKAKADVNARDNKGETALFRAARGGNAKVINMLIEAGADDVIDKNGKTALLHSAEYGNAETVKALIDAGSNVKQKDKSGKMAVDYARQNEALKGTDTLKRLEDLSK